MILSDLHYLILALPMKQTDFYSAPIDNYSNVFLEESDGMGSRALVKLHTPDIAYIALEISKNSKLGRFKKIFNKIIKILEESGVKIITGAVDSNFEGGKNFASHFGFTAEQQIGNVIIYRRNIWLRNNKKKTLQKPKI